MKYSILPFIIGLLLAACSGRYGNEHTFGTKVAVDTVKHYEGLLDSIRIETMRRSVMHDSSKIISVRHYMADTVQVEEVTYIDYRMRCNLDDWINELHEGFSLYINDTTRSIIKPADFVLNPFKEFNGKTFMPVCVYHGQLMLYSSMESNFTFIDSCVLITNAGPGFWYYYVNANKDDNSVYYNLSSDQETRFDWKIKEVDETKGLFLFKNCQRDTHYELRILSKEAYRLPTIITITSDPEDYDDAVTPNVFDPINHDSLWNSK